MELAAALRLCIWDEQGLTPHLREELPSGRQAVIDAFRWLDRSAASQEKERPPYLAPRVMLLTHRLAWQGRELLNAEVAIGFPEDEGILDELVDFVWKHRHKVPTKHRDPTI
jgi:hypothetical protein